MDTYNIIKRPLRTEKSVADGEATNSYHVEVDLRANKIQIKNAVEKYFKVKVQDVRTIVRKGKTKRVRFKLGRTKDWKKAVIKLKEGSTIDFGY